MPDSESNRGLDQITELARIFRAAILACDPKTLPITLQRFPAGACGDASLLLAKYLEKMNYRPFQYVLGERDGRSHAWLERDDIIVDITADQFEDQEAPVIVTTDKSWHSLFRGEPQHVADFCIFDSHTYLDLSNAYELIIGKIQTEVHSQLPDS